MSIPVQKTSVSSIKAWLFPSLVAILGWMIKSDINEMKSDVKALLAQSNIDKTKIEHLESDVQALNKAVFKISDATVPSRRSNEVAISKMVYGKPEEMYDIKKQLNIIED